MLIHKHIEDAVQRGARGGGGGRRGRGLNPTKDSHDSNSIINTICYAMKTELRR